MNPYEVLGVSENADGDTIKRAYKELVKKYHPDKYVNNPLADLASEKLKEINKAYDMLTNKQGGGYNSRANGGYNGGGYNGGGYSQANSGQASFQNVRVLINMRNFAAAEQMLMGLPKNAEWNYLMGLIKIQQGMYDSGINFVRNAVNMDPNNVEYRSTLNNIQNRNTQYRGYSGGGSSCVGGTPCDCCTQLCVADCCCECLGGDLITCC